MDYAEEPSGEMDYEEAPYDQNGDGMEMDDVPVTQEDAWAVVSEKVPPPFVLSPYFVWIFLTRSTRQPRVTYS